MRPIAHIINRRRFLKRGALFIPATWGVRRALAQSLNLADGPFIGSGLSCDRAAATTLANAWSAQVVANGGAAPAAGSVTAVRDFYCGMAFAGLSSSMLNASAIVPDNLIASMTPLWSTAGLNPWLTTAIIAGDLTVNGIAGNGSTKWIKPGVQGTHFPSDTSIGISVYAFSAPGSGTLNTRDIGYTNDTASDAITLAPKDFTTNTIGIACDGSGTGGSITVASPGAGYYSLNRTASNVLKMYFANSGTAHAQLGTTFAGSAGARGAHELYILAENHWNAGGAALFFSSSRLSYVSFHSGFTQAQSATEFSLVQALRVALGGGSV